MITMRIAHPTWPERVDERPRVLVENQDFGCAYAMERILESEGFEVAVCGGPNALEARCPLIASGHCALAAGADVIVHSLNPDRLEHAVVLRALRSHHPDTPRIVEVPGPATVRHGELLEGSTVVAMPITRTTFLRAVRSSAGAGEAPDLHKSVDPLVGDGDTLECEHCGDTHEVFTLDGVPRLQAVRCGDRTIPVAMENQRFRSFKDM
jgi:hypothetical protein